MSFQTPCFFEKSAKNRPESKEQEEEKNISSILFYDFAFFIPLGNNSICNINNWSYFAIKLTTFDDETLHHLFMLTPAFIISVTYDYVMFRSQGLSGSLFVSLIELT